MKISPIATVAASAAAILVVATGCGSSSDKNSGTTATAAAPGGSVDRSVSGDISVMATWTGAEQRSFQAVLAAFEKRYPNVSVSYRSGGDQCRRSSRPP